MSTYLSFMFLLLFLQLTAAVDVRPVYNIGHMVNALWQVDQFLDLGANAIEADFAFDYDGTAKWTYHGFPCDCFRSCRRYAKAVDFINYVRELTEPDSPKYRKDFVMFFLDLKISWMSHHLKHRAGADVALKFIDHLWLRGRSKTKVWILLSFPLTTDSSFLVGFKETLIKNGFGHMLSKIGWDISGNEYLDDIHITYKGLNVTESVWQGDGITNCLPRWTTRLLEAVQKRDWHQEWHFLNKVYYWTLDNKSTIRSTLRMGVDGVITNHPDRFVAVLAEKEFSSTHRLATIRDNPWDKVRKHNKYLSSDEVEHFLFDCQRKNETDEEVYYPMYRLMKYEI